MRVKLGFAPALLVLLAAALLPGASRTGSAQQPPIELIKVAQLDSLLRKGTQIQVVDVRSRQEYLTRHIKGAVSVPLNELNERYREIRREGFAVLY